MCACVRRPRSKTPPAKRKRRFKSHSRSGSRESPAAEQPTAVKAAEVIPDVVKSCDVSGTDAKSHDRFKAVLSACKAASDPECLNSVGSRLDP